MTTTIEGIWGIDCECVDCEQMAESMTPISPECRCARHNPRGRHKKGLGPCLVKTCRCPYGRPEPTA